MTDKVYFEEGLWAIVKDVPSRGRALYSFYYMDHISSIRHRCKLWKRGHVTHPSLTWKVDTPICSNCHELVPDSIVGLWKLHNWNALQEMASTETRWVGRPGQIWEYSPSTGPR